MDQNSKLRIIVSGLAGMQPVGGMAWHYFQYILGFARLGHDIYYHEDTWTWPFHPVRNTRCEDGEYSAQFIGSFFESYAPDLADRWHYLHLHETSFGLSHADFDEIAKTADLWINVSGACFIPDRLSANCVKVFLDTDPGYNQIVLHERPSWSPNVERWSKLVDEHDRHFTFAENINSDNCIIPSLGLTWIPTRMPAVLDCWEFAERSPGADAAWSTIVSWSGFPGPLKYCGNEYMSKGPEFEKLLDLPGLVNATLRLAVGGVDAPKDTLVARGWDLLDGPTLTRMPNAYAEFIVNSRGEISAAKHVYVATRSGWFSDRSICYLASGRPVVVQDTGVSEILPVGHGLLVFDDLAQAADAIQEVESSYENHAQAARQIACDYFDSDRVLAKLIEDAFAGGSASANVELHPEAPN